MNEYRINYTLSNDYDIIIKAKNREKAKEKADFKINPDNEYDWWKINYIVSLDEDNKVKQKLKGDNKS